MVSVDVLYTDTIQPKHTSVASSTAEIIEQPTFLYDLVLPIYCNGRWQSNLNVVFVLVEDEETLPRRALGEAGNTVLFAEK